MKTSEVKKYYDIQEVDIIMYDYIKKTAQDLKLELGKRKTHITSKKVDHV